MISCHQNGKRNTKCVYSMDDLFKKYDSTKFKMAKSRTLDWIDVTEIVDSGSGESNLYQFDKNNMLRFYAFINDSNNDFTFSVKYDSLGNVENKTGRDVVRWHLSSRGSDSLDLTFFLYGINYSYWDITLVIGVDSISNLEIFKSAYSNLFAYTQTIKNSRLKDDSVKRRVYVYGKKVNMCTNDTTIFSDLGYLPNVVK